MSENNNQNSGRQVSINTQYIKDLSFENPNAFDVFQKIKSQPKIDLNVDIEAAKIKDDLFEVTLNISAKAKNEDEIIFVVELNYAGVFIVQNIAAEELEMILLVYCPNILFPYARRIISDATRDGGYPPMMIDPIDFFKLYQGKKAAESNQEEKQEEQIKETVSQW